MSSEIALLNLLQSLPEQSFKSEIDFTSTVIPQFVKVLGYSESETFYEYHAGQSYRADLVLSSSRESKPWVVIEIKNSKGIFIDLSIQQVNSYLRVLECNLGVVLTSQKLLLIKGTDVNRFNLSSIGINDARDILRVLGRESQLLTITEKISVHGELVSLIEAVEEASSNDEKGKTLEVLGKFLFDSIPSLKCKYTNLQTRSSEIDLVIEYDHSKGEIPLFEEIGRYCLVECKNWNKPVGVSPVRDFIGKLDKCKTRLGIILSKNGVTGVDSGADALREIQSKYDRDEVYLLVFSLEELKCIKSGIDFSVALDFKADSLRFDTDGY